jgi:hypothetical protein
VNERIAHLRVTNLHISGPPFIRIWGRRGGFCHRNITYKTAKMVRSPERFTRRSAIVGSSVENSCRSSRSMRRKDLDSCSFPIPHSKHRPITNRPTDTRQSEGRRMLTTNCEAMKAIKPNTNASRLLARSKEIRAIPAQVKPFDFSSGDREKRNAPAIHEERRSGHNKNRSRYQASLAAVRLECPMCGCRADYHRAIGVNRCRVTATWVPVPTWTVDQEL